jgi:hypothetical protein
MPERQNLALPLVAQGVNRVEARRAVCRPEAKEEAHAY